MPRRCVRCAIAEQDFAPLLIATLTPLQRLALAYAPARARLPWLALLALDTRLAGIVREAREPMLAQIKLAWWRDRLGEEPAKWPVGEPRLAALRSWGGEAARLGALVDGWEALLAGEASARAGLIAGRAAAVATLARVLGTGDLAAVDAMARCWAAGDLAAMLANAETQAIADGLDWTAHRLPRAMRPLAVLHGLAARHRRTATNGGIAEFFVVLRLGILGG